METTIHFILILDKSGSMGCLQQTVISCFNEQIDSILKMQRENTECDIKITFCTFNDEINIHYLTAAPNSLERLSVKNYKPDLCTALYDAIGVTVTKVKELISEKDRVYLAIFTDGFENASHKYTGNQIKALFANLKENHWEIQFFCSTESSLHYRESFDLDNDNMCSLSLNEEGIKHMNHQIMYSLREMVSTNKNTSIFPNKNIIDITKLSNYK
jgi:hypothetical protein